MKTIKIFSILMILLLLLTSCWEECQTKECFDYKIQQQELEQKRIQDQRAFELEKAKIQAEIEASKPVEVKVQELKNEETTTWEWIVQAVWIWAATYVWWKIIDNMFKY